MYLSFIVVYFKFKMVLEREWSVLLHIAVVIGSIKMIFLLKELLGYVNR